MMSDPRRIGTLTAVAWRFVADLVHLPCFHGFEFGATPTEIHDGIDCHQITAIFSAMWYVVQLRCMPELDIVFILGIDGAPVDVVHESRPMGERDQSTVAEDELTGWRSLDPKGNEVGLTRYTVGDQAELRHFDQCAHQ